MKLSVRGLAGAVGALWGGAMLVVTLIGIASPGYGGSFLELVASVYPGLGTEPSLGNALLGGVYGAVDGAIFGGLLAWLYNRFAGA